jgi:hypothetical protein
MRSGEWLRTQWIARVTFDAAPPASHIQPTVRGLAVLRRLEREGLVEHRAATELRRGDLAPSAPVAFPLPRSEWRLVYR